MRDAYVCRSIYSLFACVGKKYIFLSVASWPFTFLYVFFSIVSSARQIRTAHARTHKKKLGEITFTKLNRQIFYGMARIVYAKSSNIKENLRRRKREKHNCQLWVNIKAVNSRLFKWESIFILFYLFFSAALLARAVHGLGGGGVVWSWKFVPPIYTMYNVYVCSKVYTLQKMWLYKI